MHSIVKGTQEIGLTEKPTYIRLQDNRVYGLCEKEDAQGIVYEDTIYHVWGMPDFPDPEIESVALVEFDGGTLFRKQTAEINDLLDTVKTLSQEVEMVNVLAGQMRGMSELSKI